MPLSVGRLSSLSKAERLDRIGVRARRCGRCRRPGGRKAPKAPEGDRRAPLRAQPTSAACLGVERTLQSRAPGAAPDACGRTIGAAADR